MNILKAFMLTALFFLVAGPAQAVDPLCVGVTQVALLDYSTGTGRICLSQATSSGPLPPTKVVECAITFHDGGGAVIGTESFIGNPGDLFPFSVPQDGTGDVVGVCTVDGQSSSAAAGTVAVIFPVDAAPEAPVFLPTS